MGFASTTVTQDEFTTPTESFTDVSTTYEDLRPNNEPPTSESKRLTTKQASDNNTSTNAHSKSNDL